MELVQSEQFQCGNLFGLMNYDTRLTLDLALTLNADGTYSLFSDGYAFEAGKRAVIGDDTGLGMISQMTAEGTYTFNGDGTYRFFFEAYNVEDPGTYTMENGVLTVTNANGLAMTPENGVLHYISSMSDMLTGDFAIGADLLG
ncbi:MAG: hypothetical protein Q4A88_00930 [Clostridia bacterium]|nr:hypothetical protein [Clostridia bacterium]